MIVDMLIGIVVAFLLAAGRREGDHDALCRRFDRDSSKAACAVLTPQRTRAAGSIGNRR